MPQVSIEEAVEEVTAPVYAWRAYRIEQRTRNYESQWVLTPLYYRGSAGGKPTLDSLDDVSDIEIDLLGWNEAHASPEMHDGAYDPTDNKSTAGKLPGFHCFHGYGQAVDYVRKARRGSNHIDDVVIAKVELGGVVVEHEMGYRAQLNRVVALEHHNADEEVRAKLAAALGWPFEIAYCDLIDEPVHKFFTDRDAEWIVEQCRMLAQAYGMSVKDIANGIGRIGAQARQAKILELNETAEKYYSSGIASVSIAPDTSAFTDQLRRELELQIKSNWMTGLASQKPFDLGTGA